MIGAGISGLAAAYYFRQRRATRASCVLTTTTISAAMPVAARCGSTAGSSSVTAAAKQFSRRARTGATAPSLSLSTLGVDVQRFETAFDRSLYPGLGLSRGMLFTREAFGVDKLVTGDPTRMVADDIPPDRLNARSASAFINDFPLDAASREKLIALYTQARDVLPGKSVKRRGRFSPPSAIAIS